MISYVTSQITYREVARARVKNIICFGNGYKDYVIYMSYVLNNMGYRIIINDMSKRKDLSNVISCNDFTIPMRTYRNIDFNFGEYVCEGYDYVLTYSDDIDVLLYMDNNDLFGEILYIIINASVNKNTLFTCKDLIKNIEGDVILILRDKVGYINKKYIGKYMISSNRILDMQEIRLDEYDKKYEYQMDYDGLIKFKYLSEDYCKSLIKSVAIITGKESDNVKRALKLAKGGRVFDNRLLE
jgi:hypothetical protein